MVPKGIHIWQGQVTYQGTTVNFCFFFQNCLSTLLTLNQITVVCSKFKFLLNCQKDTETAMKLMYGSL